MSLRLTSVFLLGVVFVPAVSAAHGPVEDRVDPALTGKHINHTLPNAVQLIESVSVHEGRLTIPYETYVLDNGLTLILHEDKSDPVAHVDVTYHVGSAREDIGKSGFAHFFEHMMFQGSENVADEEHFRIVSESGGTLNGTTNNDRTNYFQTVPSNQLEKMLWLEADRMGFLLPAVTQESFEIQRATVKNERAQNYENKPYGLVMERVGEAAYPDGHPYSWMPIGYVEDLDRVNVNDLKAFFLRWYGPNNATLTIGGDFDRQQVLDWVVKYFGPISRGPEVDKPAKWDVTLDADRYISMEDRVSLPLLFKAIPTVYARHEDEAPLDVLMSIIGGGETSMLYEALVKTGLAVSAGTGHGCRELSCLFTIQALPNPASGTSLADLDRLIRKTLSAFEARGVEEDDLLRVKAGIRAGTIFGLESVSGKISKLAHWQTLHDDPNLIQAEIDRYDAVTAEDVMRVYRQYIKDQPAVIMSVVPTGQLDAVAAPDTWERTPRTLPDYAEMTETNLALRDVTDRFDRSVQPPAGEPPFVEMPALWETELPNGIPVLGTLSDEVPTTTLALRLRTGQRDEPLDRLGLSALTAAMLNESTALSSNAEIANRLQKLGASVRVGAGQDHTMLTVRSLTENLGETLAIAEEMLFNPGFIEADFERLKNQTLEGIRSAQKDAGAVAGTVRPLLLYGRENAFAWPSSGTEQSVADITLEDVRAFYETRYSPTISEVVVVSDLSQDAIVSHLEAFGTWQGEAVEPAAIQPFPDLASGTLYLIDRPGAAQSEIRIARRALPYDATGELYRATLMAYPLGGAFNSRINLNLREDKGYTYGASAGFGAGAYAGSFTVSAGVRQDVTAAAITEIFKELEGFAETGMTAEELAFTQAAIGQREARAYETPGQKAGLIGQLLTYDLEPTYRAEQSAILEALTTTETQRLAQAQIRPDEMITIVVGDKAAILEDLQTLGRPIVELDTLGRPIVGAVEVGAVQ